MVCGRLGLLGRLGCVQLRQDLGGAKARWVVVLGLVCRVEYVPILPEF